MAIPGVSAVTPPDAAIAPGPAVAGPGSLPPTRTPTRTPARSRWQRFTGELYPSVARRPLTRRSLLWGAIGLVVAVVVNLLRTGGHGALDTIWIEDSITFLNDAYNKHFGDVIFHPESGYFQLVPKTFAEIAGALPIRFAAPALALQAATVWAIVAVIAFVASRPYLPTWWLRVLVAAPVVLVPAGHSQADNDVATLHFPLLYLLFWVLMWQPVTRFGKIVAIVATLLAATSSILAIAFIPLALLRLFSLRSWAHRAVSIVYLAGMVLQLGGLAFGVSVRDAGPTKYNPVWALREYVREAIPRSVFGEKWLGGPKVDVGGVPTAAYDTFTSGQLVLVVVAVAIVVAVAACGLLGITRPHWPLALVAFALSVGIFCEAIMAMGVVQPRYVIPAALLLFVAVVATLRPRPTGTGPHDGPADAPALEEPTDGSSTVDGTVEVPRTRARWSSTAPVLAFATLLAVVCVANYRVHNARATSPSWSVTAHEAVSYCRSWDRNAPFYFFGYDWWNLEIPCDRLR